ncbi:hypothetical protein DHEL01_v211164 [Diaporthe helianthi]|uniref:F-box domain-containing protein n=1 Tax=Diaporthe helianthi TaxID=158607 RepID=A0A2P5HJK6_DIAHE|nr:hypothetical protein DHEL01_v211164 [Diaporthe helianthi]
MLPAELRKIIWRDLLVTGKVYVSFTSCRLLLAQRGAKIKQRAKTRISGADEKHVEYYGVQSDDAENEGVDMGTYFSPRRCQVRSRTNATVSDDWAEYAAGCMAMKPPVKFRDSYHPRPQLNILLACRQARKEAETIFYKENRFTFCTCNQNHDYNATRDISAAHAACCFLQDRSQANLNDIKHIELHVLHWEVDRGALLNTLEDVHFRQPNIAKFGEMARFIESHMNLQSLSIHVGGGLPEGTLWSRYGQYLPTWAFHPELDQLIQRPLRPDMNPRPGMKLKRLSIRWISPAMSPRVCGKHGAWCFDSTRGKKCCPLASMSLASIGLIKDYRYHFLEKGSQLGLSKIRGGLMFNTTKQTDSMYLVMETDDELQKDGTWKSCLARERASGLNESNVGLLTLASPRWAFEQSCMESISDDFYKSLRRSRTWIRPSREQVTFHLVWLDGIDADVADLPLDCEEF